MGPGAPADQQPTLTAPDNQYIPGTPSWVPLIDACMASGGLRGDCINALPAEELHKLETWEESHQRRELLRMHRDPTSKRSDKNDN